MLGFHGYGTNEYGSLRNTIKAGPIVRLLVKVLQSVYGVGTVLRLPFRNTTLTEPQWQSGNTLTL